MLLPDTRERLLPHRPEEVRHGVSNRCPIQQPEREGGGMMTALMIMMPLLPGKQEAWRQFCQILQGSRHGDYAA